VADILEAVKSLLTQHFPIPRPAPHGGPTTFAVHLEHYSDPDPEAILVDALRGDPNVHRADERLYPARLDREAGGVLRKNKHSTGVQSPAPPRCVYMSFHTR